MTEAQQISPELERAISLMQSWIRSKMHPKAVFERDLENARVFWKQLFIVMYATYSHRSRSFEDMECFKVIGSSSFDQNIIILSAVVPLVF